MTHRQYTRRSNPTTLDELSGHVPQTHIDGAKAASEAFREAGIAHVLVGGLAVGICGYPRPTRDIDFLVGDEAFEFHGPIVTHKAGLPISYMGVGIDWVSLEDRERPVFERFLTIPAPGVVPAMPVEPLVAMKLLAGRQKDQADIVEIIKSGTDLESLRTFVKQNFPNSQKISLLNYLIDQASREE